MQVLVMTQVRLTKVAEALRSSKGTEWEALGLDEWMRSPALSEAVRRFPDLEARFREELSAAFSPKGTVQLAQLADFPAETRERFIPRGAGSPEIPEPFESYCSPGATHVAVFAVYVKPRLVTDLPTGLFGLRVESGEGEPQQLITRDTLEGTNFEALVAGSPEYDEEDLPVRFCIGEIADFLSRARRNGADVVAGTG